MHLFNSKHNFFNSFKLMIDYLFLILELYGLRTVLYGVFLILGEIYKCL